VQRMIDAGLVEEVRALRELSRPLSRQAAQALGYKEMFRYLDGQATLAETVEQIQTRTRNFAKRQITWFRHIPQCLPVTDELTFTLGQAKSSDRKSRNPSTRGGSGHFLRPGASEGSMNFSVASALFSPYR